MPARIIMFYEKAAQDGADLVVFPELSLVGVSAGRFGFDAWIPRSGVACAAADCGQKRFMGLR